MSSSRRAWSVACLLFLAFFFLYLKTFCASIYLDDSGETATIAWTLGIGHPPGYPLHTLLAHIATFFPLGDPGLRVSLFSVALGAFCAPLAFFCAKKYADFPSAIFAACTLCLGPVFWHQALIAKGSIYMLNNAITLFILILLLGSPGDKILRLIFLLLGLGLAHHYMSQLVLWPCYLILLFSGLRRQPLLSLGFWILPGLSLYLFLPLRAQQSPLLNWGDIHSLGGLLFFLSRAQYSGSEISRSFMTSWIEFTTALGDLIREGAWIAPLLLGIGLWGEKLRLKRQRGLLLGMLMPLAAVAFYLNLSGTRLNLLEPYLFPAYLCQAILAAWGLDWLLSRSTLLGKFALIGSCVLALGLPLNSAYASQDESSFFYAQDNARNILQALPAHSVLFCSGDVIIFPLWYLQDVKHARPDVTVVGTPVLPMPWVGDQLHKSHPEFKQPNVSFPIGTESIDPLVGAMLALNQGRMPLYSTDNQLGANASSWSLVPQGPVFLIKPSAQTAPADALPRAEAQFQACINRGFYSSPHDVQVQSLIIADRAIRRNSLGTWLEEKNDYRDALNQYLQASLLDPKSAAYLFNAGNALNDLGQREEAMLLYEQAVSRDSGYENAWFNLAVTHFMLHQDAAGCQALKKALGIDPHDSNALAQAGRCGNMQ